MTFKDQLGRIIDIPYPPKRIISLVPSQTELLYDLGLKDRIIGQTIFCIHPQKHFKSAVKIGGTKKLHLNEIFSLKPDLVIANKEENEKEQIEELAGQVPVWVSDVNTLNDALDMIRLVGEITRTNKKALEIINQIETNRNELALKTPDKRKVIYLIWQNPYLAVGHQTFIDTMLQEAGFENMITDSRYPEITIEIIKKMNPDVVLLSTEPFPFKSQHLTELNQILGKDRCRLVDGEMFSWYGSRLIKAFPYFKKLK